MGIFSAGKSKRISFFSGERWIRHLDYFQLCTPSFHNISIGGSCYHYLYKLWKWWKLYCINLQKFLQELQLRYFILINRFQPKIVNGGSCFFKYFLHIIFSWINFLGVSNFNKKTIGVMPVSLLSVYLFTVTTSSLQNISIRFSNFYKRSSRLADFSAKSSPEKE